MTSAFGVEHGDFSKARVPVFQPVKLNKPELIGVNNLSQKNKHTRLNGKLKPLARDRIERADLSEVKNGNKISRFM